MADLVGVRREKKRELIQKILVTYFVMTNYVPNEKEIPSKDYFKVSIPELMNVTKLPKKHLLYDFITVFGFEKAEKIKRVQYYKIPYNFISKLHVEASRKWYSYWANLPFFAKESKKGKEGSILNTPQIRKTYFELLQKRIKEEEKIIMKYDILKRQEIFKLHTNFYNCIKALQIKASRR